MLKILFAEIRSLLVASLPLVFAFAVWAMSCPVLVQAAESDLENPAAETATKTSDAALPKPLDATIKEQDEGQAKEIPAPENITRRATSITPQAITAPVNKAGPEFWPEDAGLSSKVTDPVIKPGEDKQSPQEPSVSSASKAAPAGDASTQKNMAVVQSVDPANKPEQPKKEGVEEKPQERPIVYMDEEGNVVPKPPVPEELFAQAMKLLEDAKYKDALPILDQLRAMFTIPKDMRERVLYGRSDALSAIHEGKPLEGFEVIVSSTEEAMNANLRSTRVPDALYRLGLAHLNVGNLAEAEGYFGALKRRYPYDLNVPTAFFLLGKAQLAKEMYTEAEDNFRSVLQEYPDSSAVKQTTMALVQALVGMKNFEEATLYADFAEKRWARHYIDEPEYLYALADIDYNLGKKNDALLKYWLLYNLTPSAKKSPDVLARIGDLYLELEQPLPAKEVFDEILENHPDTDAAALAMLRNAEKGLFDSPIEISEMYAVFEDPGKPLPQVAYQELFKKRPQDARSITALLKYALWQLWDKQYADAMGTAGDFIDLHPENTDVELARDVIMRGFMADLKNSLLEENYGRILTLWNGFPLVRERYGPIDANLRNAIARGYLERGEDEKAMEYFKEFLKTPMHPKYSEPTFALYFNKYLEKSNWNAMLDLGELVKDWDMPKAMRLQLDYAMALSWENLGLRDKALVMWIELANNTEIPKYQRAYATYFLAKDAENRKDIKDAYSYNLQTLKLFDELKEERSDRADDARRKETMGTLMDITEVANRIPESLEWLERYNQFVAKDSPEYPGLRFREARLYRKLGNNEKARNLLEVVAQNYPNSPFAAAANTELATFNVSRDLQNFLPQTAAQ